MAMSESHMEEELEELNRRVISGTYWADAAF